MPAGGPQSARSSLIPLLWFGLPVLLMSYVGQPVHPFYQLLGLPAGYALVGWVEGAEPEIASGLLPRRRY